MKILITIIMLVGSGAVFADTVQCKVSDTRGAGFTCAGQNINPAYAIQFRLDRDAVVNLNGAVTAPGLTDIRVGHQCLVTGSKVLGLWGDVEGWTVHSLLCHQ